MNIFDSLLEQLFYYHNATDLPLQLFDANGNLLQAFDANQSYCELTREACGNRNFCARLH